MQFETSPRTPVGALGTEARAAFISRTYGHLAGAVIALVLFEMLLFRFELAEPIVRSLFGMGPLVLMGLFMLVSWGASRVAFRATSPAAQYAALFGYVVAQALILLPLLVYAEGFAKGAITSAALITLVAFSGLTAIVFVTRKDFSFLRAVLLYGFVIALVAVLGGAIFGFVLGTWFSVAMVAFAGVAVLYDTSNVLHHYPEDRHVGAALQLFASIAMMFFYVLRLLAMSRD